MRFSCQYVILNMFELLTFFSLSLVSVINAGYYQIKNDQFASLKPNSLCCNIPELGDITHLIECSNPKLPGPCDDIQCVFEVSGFLTDRDTLNKDIYRNHLRKWATIHRDWTPAVDEAIHECIDKTPRQLLENPCKAYDVFICTEIAMAKKCPVKARKCYSIMTRSFAGDQYK